MLSTAATSYGVISEGVCAESGDSRFVKRIFWLRTPDDTNWFVEQINDKMFDELKNKAHITSCTTNDWFFMK